jgi:hypothetical protein
MIAARSGGTSERRSGLGSVARTRSRYDNTVSSSGLSDENGGAPSSNVNSVEPSDHWSSAGEGSPPLIIWGAAWR